MITPKGEKWFNQIGIDIDEVKQKKRSFAHKCLDWTERRHHLAGSLGSAFLTHMISNDWLRKKQFTREIYLTSKGKQELYNILNLEV